MCACCSATPAGERVVWCTRDTDEIRACNRPSWSVHACVHAARLLRLVSASCGAQEILTKSGRLTVHHGACMRVCMRPCVCASVRIRVRALYNKEVNSVCCIPDRTRFQTACRFIMQMSREKHLLGLSMNFLQFTESKL